MDESPLPPSFAAGLSAFQAGDPARAEAVFRGIFAWHPSPAGRAAHLTGMLAHQAGRVGEAMEKWRQAIALDPTMPEPQVMLARSLVETGRSAEAIAVFEQAVVRCPSSGILWASAARCLMDAHRISEAAEAAHRSVQLDPTPDRMFLLGTLLQVLNRHEESRIILAEARARWPGEPRVAHALAAALRKTKRPHEALAMIGEALRMAPGEAPFHYELAELLLCDMGDPVGAVASMARALDCNPSFARCHSHWLLAQHYRWAGDPAELRRLHEAWADRHGRFPPIRSGPIPPLAGRRLRVGYVSADLYGSHPVTAFFNGIAEHHDRGAFEVFLYLDAGTPDPTTDRFAALGDQVRMVEAWDDETLARQVAADGIDLLVDLGGHAGRRLGVFARKPAPVQATYLGYPDTTGLAAMDYRIVDAVTDPPGVADAWSTERLVRLPGCFLTYRPPASAPPVAPPPLEAHGGVTFTSFNLFAKVTPAWAACAAEILRQVPGSRLLMKSAGFLESAEVKARLERLFAATGIGMDRIDFQLEEKEYARHLTHYARVDIALDTFPYHGTTTTCEALWMGVPVVSLAGPIHASRVGASLLASAGLQDLVAQTPEEYVAKAVALARDPARLCALRAGLRERLRPLCDGAAFTRRLEEAYRGMVSAPVPAGQGQATPPKP